MDAILERPTKKVIEGVDLALEDFGKRLDDCLRKKTYESAEFLCLESRSANARVYATWLDHYMAVAERVDRLIRLQKEALEAIDVVISRGAKSRLNEEEMEHLDSMKKNIAYRRNLAEILGNLDETYTARKKEASDFVSAHIGPLDELQAWLSEHCVP